jgi:tetratricopeptide (TPR) repeat protein
VSRTRNDEKDAANDPTQAYFQLSRMVREGRSWSGRERNCAFLNTADGRFATASAASGFDFPDDARAVALVDWDQDGDEDLWVSNRNAPRLRLLRNESSGNRFLAVKLAGDGASTNRDAIGARVEVRAAGDGARRRVKTLRAGEGFLAQSSKWLHFGLGKAAAVEKVIVRWPGGEAEEFAGIEADRRYLLVQGSGKAVEAPRPPGRLAIAPSDPPLPPESGKARIPLVALLPVPRLEYAAFDGAPRAVPIGGGRPVLVNLWASWCAPCAGELGEIAAARDAIRAAGLDVAALAVDGLGDDRSDPLKAVELMAKLDFPFAAGRATRQAVLILQRLHDATVPLHRRLPVPASFLIDGSGRLSVIYKGPVTPAQAIADLAHSGGTRRERWSRAAAFPGRAIDHPRIEESARLAEAQMRFLLAGDFSDGGRFEDARVEYEEALAVLPTFAEARNNLGTALRSLGDLEGAEREYRRAIESRPDIAAAHSNLGALLEHRGLLPAAEVSYREALRLEPGRPGLSNALGLACAKQGKLDEARGFFERAVAGDPASAEARSNLGRLLLEKGEDSAAEGHLREAARLAPADPEVRNNLGVLLKRRGSLDEAAAEYREAIRLAPSFPQARNNLGAVLLNQGKLEEAAAELESALRVAPDFAPARANLERVRALQRARGGEAGAPPPANQPR